MTCERGLSFCVLLLATGIDLACPLVTEVSILGFTSFSGLFRFVLCNAHESPPQGAEGAGEVDREHLSLHPTSASQPALPRPSSPPSTPSPAIRKNYVSRPEQRSRKGAEILTSHGTGYLQQKLSAFERAGVARKPRPGPAEGAYDIACKGSAPTLHSSALDTPRPSSLPLPPPTPPSSEDSSSPGLVPEARGRAGVGTASSLCHQHWLGLERCAGDD